MTPSARELEDVGIKPARVELTPTQISLSSAKTSHPALLRLHQKLEGRNPDIGVVTDYSRMHHRHNRD